MNQSILLDDGFQMGLGVFETILVRNGQGVFLKEHLNRLNTSLTRLGINQVVTTQEVKQELASLKIVNGALKIMISPLNTVFLHRQFSYTPQDYENGFHLKTSSCIQDSRNEICSIKTLSRLNLHLELKKAKSEGYNEVLFLNEQQKLTEGSISNIFFVKEGKLRTPHEECGLLPGILRDYICKQVPVEKGFYELADILSAEEVLITNSLMGIMGVTAINQVSFPLGQCTKKLQIDYQKFLEVHDERSV